MFIPSAKQTADHLKEITDEVAGLHPILNALFRKMPGIKRVHYNQGANELGADFLLEKEEPALMRTAWVGVVVKVGQIRQNTMEVDRQIGECFIERKGRDGREIQIREVWVVSSHEITNNAKEVLNKKYSDKKIDFISGQELAHLIDKFAPDSFTAITPQLQDYADALSEGLDADDNRSLIVPGMEAFYVEPKISRRDFDLYGNTKNSKRIKDLGDLLRNIEKSQFSVLEAGAGGGKSRLARELVRRVIASTEFAEGSTVPIINHAKIFVGNFEGAVEDGLNSVEKLRDKDPRILLFVDGFDELDLDDKGRNEYVSNLVSAVSAKNISVALLSRPFNMVAVLGPRLRSVDVFEIEPLRGTKAGEFLTKVAGQIDVKSRILSDLGKSPLLKALDGTPIAYILLGRLIAENHQDLPSNLTELFQKYSELVLGRWEISKGLRSQKEYEVLVEALIWLASYMLKNELSEIAVGEFRQWIERYCRERSIDLDINGLVERASNRGSILFLRSDTGSVGFRHRAFAEFFHARDLMRAKSVEVNAEVFSPYWINSFYFLAGLQRDCPDLIQSLLSVELKDDAQRILRILNLGNLLLAGYLTPTHVCERAVREMAIEAAEVFVTACDPGSGSPLAQLPTIQMLCAMTTAFRSQYGYEHFGEALELSILKLEDDERSERNAITLFLLDAAYQESGGSLRFDELIDKFGDSLPLIVRLAIGHETDRMKHVSDRVKKMERNMRRMFKANRSSGKFLEKLYKVPVRKLDRKLI